MSSLAEVEEKIDSVEKEIKQKIRTKEKLEAEERSRKERSEKVSLPLKRFISSIKLQLT